MRHDTETSWLAWDLCYCFGAGEIHGTETSPQTFDWGFLHEVPSLLLDPEIVEHAELAHRSRDSEPEILRGFLRDLRNRFPWAWHDTPGLSIQYLFGGDLPEAGGDVDDAVFELMVLPDQTWNLRFLQIDRDKLQEEMLFTLQGEVTTPMITPQDAIELITHGVRRFRYWRQFGTEILA